MLKNSSIIYFLSNPIKFLIIVIYFIPFTIYAQTELDYKIVNKIKNESHDNSHAFDILNHITGVFGPRLSGSKIYMDAARWAKHQLESWGLEDVHFEEISRCRNISFLWGCSMISGIFHYMLVAKQYAHKTNNELESKWNSYCFNFNAIAI